MIDFFGRVRNPCSDCSGNVCTMNCSVLKKTSNSYNQLEWEFNQRTIVLKSDFGYYHYSLDYDKIDGQKFDQALELFCQALVDAKGAGHPR